jgi:thiosulfate/3-mercaptopyruvate sulfurtransferase
MVSCSWLSDHVDDPGVRIIDMRWMDNQAGYLAGHVPGAVFVAMASLADPSNPTPDMLAPPSQFADVVGGLGISAETLVVVYDDVGPPVVASRLWWALNYYGHDRVRVLDGGLRQWLSEARPVAQGAATSVPTNFVPRPRSGWLVSKREVLAAIDEPETVIIDCLNSELYRGVGERHTWGTRKGHIPGALNVPYLSNFDPKLATASRAEERQAISSSSASFKLGSPALLRQLYRNAGVREGARVITYCGRGYAAAIGLLALKVVGHDSVALYDGSWAEWSADTSLPVELGAGEA